MTACSSSLLHEYCSEVDTDMIYCMNIYIYICFFHGRFDHLAFQYLEVLYVRRISFNFDNQKTRQQISEKKICEAADSKSKALADWFFRWTVLHQHGRCLGWRLGADGFVVARVVKWI